MIRAFVAIELSKDILYQLTLAQDTLRKCRAHIRFVDPRNIHITVKFLGDINQKLLQQVIYALESVTDDPFPITAGTVTVNNTIRPRTIWSSIDDAGRIEELFCRIEEALSPLGFGRESRSFTPHATLARVKSSDPSLFSARELLRGKSYGSCIIQGIKLKKSTLGPLGPVYEDLLEVIW